MDGKVSYFSLLLSQGLAEQIVFCVGSSVMGRKEGIINVRKRANKTAAVLQWGGRPVNADLLLVEVYEVISKSIQSYIREKLLCDTQV